MEKIKTYKIKYIPTGNIFDMPKEECDRLIQEDPNNFEVTDKDYAPPQPEEVIAGIQHQIIVEDSKSNENPYKSLKNKDAVIEVLKEREIEFDPSAKRTDLEALLIADDKEKTEG